MLPPPERPWSPAARLGRLAVRADTLTGANMNGRRRRAPTTDGAERQAIGSPAQALVTLAWRLSLVYVARCAPRALLLTGSTAEGLADEYSDLDMVAYYEGSIPTMRG